MTYPRSKAYIGDEGIDIAGEEIAETEEGHEENSRRWGHALDLDHGENLRHLPLQCTSVEQPGGGGDEEASH